MHQLANWKELNGRTKIKNVAAMPSKQTSTEKMKSHQLKKLTGIVSENQIWENTSLWPDSVQQCFFCIPSSKFVTFTKFTTGTRNGIYICPEIEALSNAVETIISDKYKPISECPNCFIHQQFVVLNQHHQNKFTVTRKQRERG